MLLCRLKMYQTTRWRALVFPVKTQHAGEFHGGSVEVGLGLYWILWYSVYRGKLVQAYAGVLECWSAYIRVMRFGHSSASAETSGDA